jgi:pilus assembly protein CpaE
MDIVFVAGAILFVAILLLGIALVLFLRRRRAASTPEAAQPEAKVRRSKGTAKQPIKVKSKEPEIVQASSNGVTPQSQPAAAPAPATLPAAKAVPIGGAKTSGERIRILIVDDNTGTRENVVRLLYFEEDMEVIGQAVNGRQGVEMASQLKPHIVLMDINMPDMDGITATREMSVVAAFSQVIIMSVQADQHYMKQAMAAGARDFQPKPFTSEELVSCIRRVYRIGIPVYQQFEAIEQAKAAQVVDPFIEQRSSGAPVIVVYAPKGGVGKSALATNLAVALQQEHGSTVLMDAALQFGDISVHLNTQPNRTIGDLMHQGKIEADLVPDVLMPHNSGLKLLLAPPRPELAESFSAETVTTIINELKKQFNAVVIDTSGPLSDINLAILELADYILVVTVPELPAVKSVKLFLEVAEQLEFAPNRLKVVVNRAEAPGSVRIDRIQEVLKLPETYRIPYDPKMHLYLAKGSPICQHESSAPSAQAITQIARQVWQTLTDNEVVAAEKA